MAIILDRDVIIRGEKGTFNLQQCVAARPDEQFEVAALIVQTILASLPLIPYTVETASEPARIWTELEPSAR